MMASPTKLGWSTRKAPNWLELPIEVTENIFQRLRVIEILKNARNVCRLWWNICKDPLMWRTIDMTDFVFCRYDHSDFEFSLFNICCYAIDLSSGCLEDIRIAYFGTNSLLQYIADRASNLRCIRLIHCDEISDKGLSEVAKKLPLLQELHISLSFLSMYSLQVIGQCCPILKSLVFVGTSIRFNYFQYGDDDMFSIAKAMPRLRHLDISLNSLTNVGLLAILNGCPLLESLEVRQCYALNFNGLAIPKTMPGLRHLDISFNSLTHVGLLAILDICPLLESLELRECFHLDLSGLAIAIAKINMSGLRQLNIRANPLTNVGLLAILDGCPLLESLDLRECFHLDLSGSLGKRCREQIKYLYLSK